ncbi:protein white-like [Panonychus citri]|uniref:protein white-like n=1 Tax=Panonychus citri TaxID=50023 RepID=UPI002307BB7E|nr:protein white-like [Panonychus citri]
MEKTGQQLSGGERKRLSIATEINLIIMDPPILFCDEPTSGIDSFMALSVISVLKSLILEAMYQFSYLNCYVELGNLLAILGPSGADYHGSIDSFMALSVISVLKSLASEQRTIICTIHQPSSEIFKLFDKIMLIADGRLAFFGTSGQAIDFFSSNGQVCPSNLIHPIFFV